MRSREGERSGVAALGGELHGASPCLRSLARLKLRSTLPSLVTLLLLLLASSTPWSSWRGLAEEVAPGVDIVVEVGAL